MTCQRAWQFSILKAQLYTHTLHSVFYCNDGCHFMFHLLILDNVRGKAVHLKIHLVQLLELYSSFHSTNIC